MSSGGDPGRAGGFPRAVAFWAGTGAVVAGVLLHFPDYVRAGAMGFRMASMPMSGLMLAGMALIATGLVLATYGLVPPGGLLRAVRPAASGGGFALRVLDDAPLGWAHWRLAGVMAIAVVVDVMKPATLGFVMPGAMAEYGLSPAGVSLWPLTALTGTTVGSILWGVLADRMGRRTSILLASLLFMGTAICGAMPTFGWNLVMCFLMGASAGGMLPIVFALLSETTPPRARGWLMVLIGGLGTVGGYLAASGAAALLESWLSWRSLWFLGLPTGALVIALNRFIPESPRFLLAQGRDREAGRVMAGFGVVLEAAPPDRGSASPGFEARPAGAGALFRRPYLAQTVSLGLYGLAWGLVNWGFLTWLPTILRDLGLEAGVANGILARAALVAAPGMLVAAWLYGRWSSKYSMVLFGLATAAILVGFAALGSGAAGRSGLLMLLVVGLLVSSSGVIAMLSPYSAEVYSTEFRGIGTGVVAASSKIGGIVGPPLIAGVLALWPGLAAAALVVTGPMVLAALVLGLTGLETRGRRLEEIHAAPPEAAGGS